MDYLSAQAFEVTPDKTVVWILSSWVAPDLGPCTCIQLLNEDGRTAGINQIR
jgi:hypothetical protein